MWQTSHIITLQVLCIEIEMCYLNVWVGMTCYFCLDSQATLFIPLHIHGWHVSMWITGFVTKQANSVIAEIYK